MSDYYMKQYNLGHDRLHAILCNDKPRQLRIEAEIRALEDEKRRDCDDHVRGWQMFKFNRDRGKG